MKQSLFAPSITADGLACTTAEELAEKLGVDKTCSFVILSPFLFDCDEILVSRIATVLSKFNTVADREISLPCKMDMADVKKCRVFAFQAKAIERCRDQLKEIFFEIYLRSNISAKLFNLQDYLIIILPVKKQHGHLIEHTFVHGIGRFYRFIFDVSKIPDNRGLLSNFLSDLPRNSPNHLFLHGPKASKGDWTFPVIHDSVNNCDLIDLAQKAANVKSMKRAHENLEKFLVLNDPKTFACEIPVWVQPSDFPDYESRFQTTNCITGHIDILRLEDDGKLGLWDYKPNAGKEKKAAQQVWFYMMMLSKRTGIPIEQIKGGYFDEHSAFSVQPRQIRLDTIF